MMFSARWAHWTYCGSDYHFLPLNGVLRTRIGVTSPPKTWPAAIWHNHFRHPEPSRQIGTRTGSSFGYSEAGIDTLTVGLFFDTTRQQGWMRRYVVLTGICQNATGWMFEPGILNNVYSPERGALGLPLRWGGCIYIRCWYLHELLSR